MKTIKEIIAMEKSIADMLCELTDQIAEVTSEASMDGVKQLAPNVVSANFSSLDSWICCPYYYTQSAQANAVERKLKESKTATSFIDKIQTMVNEKKVKLGNEVIRLNPKTIEILQSYLNNI